MTGDHGSTARKPADWMGEGIDLAERMAALADRLRLASTYSGSADEAQALRAAAGDIDVVLAGEFDPRDDDDDDSVWASAEVTAGSLFMGYRSEIKVTSPPRWASWPVLRWFR